MYLMIDNYDSFVYNLKAYFEELGREIVVKRSDQITVDEIEEMQPAGNHSVPRTETSVGCSSLCRDSENVCREKFRSLESVLDTRYLDTVPGATVEKGERPMHGKVTGDYHIWEPVLFEGTAGEV